jgi:hypothetical protein
MGAPLTGGAPVVRGFARLAQVEPETPGIRPERIL